MNPASSPLERVNDALLHPTNHLVGLVYDLLAACQEHGLRFDWRDGRCRVRSLRGGPDGMIDVPLRKSVFRAILARLAVLCNERRPNSVSPYGGQGEVVVGGYPAKVFRVEFVNTPDEQRLELTHVSPEAIVPVPSQSTLPFPAPRRVFVNYTAAAAAILVVAVLALTNAALHAVEGEVDWALVGALVALAAVLVPVIASVSYLLFRLWQWLFRLWPGRMGTRE